VSFATPPRATPPPRWGRSGAGTPRCSCRGGPSRRRTPTPSGLGGGGATLPRPPPPTPGGASRACPAGERRAAPRGARRGNTPAVLLEEHGYLTDFRTAAAVALTLKYLAPKDAHDALLVGAGALARLTARAMVAQLPLARLTLWNRTRERAEGLARELAQVVDTRIAPALESAVRDHRVRVT